MIKFQSAPESKVSGVPPMAVLVQRDGVGEKFSASEWSRVCGVQSVLSSGCCIEFRKRCVGGVSGVGRVSVKRNVASLLRPRAFVPAFPVPAFGPSSDGPKSVLQSALQKSRRAAGASKLARMQQRLAAKSETDQSRQSCVSSMSLRGVAWCGVG